MSVWQRRTILIVIGLVFTYIWSGFIDLQVVHHRAWQARSIANQRSVGLAVADPPKPANTRRPPVRIPTVASAPATITPARLRNFLRRCARKARIWVSRPLRVS